MADTPPPIDERGAKLIADAIAKNQGGNSAPKSTGPVTTGFEKADSYAGSVGDKLKERLGVGADAAGKGLSDLKAATQENIGAFQNLSKSGANFSNDLVGMRAAQAGSRVSLGEFTDTIQKNNTAFVGLGGNVSKGAENFAKLTKEMYDNNAVETDRLRSMGITNKELNDTLALQISFQRGSFKDNKEGHEESIKAATELADQMNKTAILTGKSRQEQEDALKKAQADSMVEAKFRLLGAQQGPEAEAKARKEFAIQMQQAEARGQGQFFKEVFATGHAISQEAATQSAMLGKQAIATAEQAKATARGDHEAASKFNEQARVEQLANSKNTSIMTAALYGDVGGAYNKQAQQQLKNDQAVYDARKKLEQDANFAKLSDQQKLAAIDKQVAEDAAAKKKDGTDKEGAATTKAALNIEQRMNDAGSAVMNKLVNPLNEKAGPSINKFADTALGAQTKLSNGQVVTKPQAFELGVTQGYKGYDGKSPTPTDLGSKALSTVGAVGKGAETVAKGVGKVVDFGKEAINGTQPKEQRDGGTLEKTGSPVEPADVIAKIHKGEAVLKPEAVQNMGLKMSEMSKMVQTTISSAGGPGGKDPKEIMEEAKRRFESLKIEDIPKLDAGGGLEAAKKKASEESNKLVKASGADKITEALPKGIEGFGGIKLPNFDEIEKTATKISPPKVDNKADAETKAKADAEAKAKTAKEQPADQKTAPAVGEISMKDLNASLHQLNITMKQVLTYTQQTATAAQAQVKATKSLSGNKFAT